MDYQHFLKSNIDAVRDSLVLIPFAKDDIVKDHGDEFIVALYREEAEALYLALKEQLLHQ